MGWGGGFNELSLRFIVLLLHGLSCDFSVMSEINLDEPGFTALGSATSPPSSDSSVDNPPEARRKCIACPRRISAKTADHHTVCVVCRVFFIVLSTPVARSALSGRMRKFVCMTNCANPWNLRIVLNIRVSLQLLFLLRPTLCPLRSLTRSR